MRGDLLNLRAVAVCDRMLSDVELVGPKGGGDHAAMNAASIQLARVRRVISIICGENAAGRVLVGSTLRVRRGLQMAWLPPVNADFVHYGALRGLDFAKNHAAAISIGRQELSPTVTSDLAAALGYDDADPSESLDKDGETVRATERRILRMRDGRDVFMDVPVMAGRWERQVQSQYREEELRQFAGRLRPVFRGGIPPVWYAMTQAPPGEFIWDELVASTDLTLADVDGSDLPRNLFEIARRGGGLLSPELALEDCPDLCALEMMVQIFTIDGIDLRTGIEADQIRDHWSKLNWRDGLGTWHFAWASPWLDDPAAAAKLALKRARYDVREVATLRRVRPIGEKKAWDEVDKTAGSLMSRHEMESNWRDEYRGGILSSASGGFVGVGEIGLERRVRRHGIEIRHSLEALLAARSTRNAEADQNTPIA
ncbi:hypothetical protein VQ042_17640 [Aurantimonas sp. A2-1-M11]|uniref:hypothetical protein n=1 Tax=Aurantimonas sp. A2-1-M11 TaxID=3113712 RepID=UPI002F920966